MEKLTLSLQALSAGDAGGQSKSYAKDLAPPLESTTESRHSLETLPVELQRLILSKVSTLQSLSAIVHASPQLHRIYAEDRVPILRLVLAETLGDILIDAIGAYRSGTDSFQKTRTEPMLWSFVEEFKKHTAPADWITDLSFDGLIRLFRFHDSVIEPLTERYASWALASLPRSSEAGDEHQPPSNTERHRIQRAMYRLQMFCHVCSYPDKRPTYHFKSHVDRLRVLLIFQPWEVEEILNIHAFAQDTYGVFHRQVAWDFNESQTPMYKKLDMPAISKDPLLICDDWTEDGYINPQSPNGILRDGLQLLYGILDTKSHEQLIEEMRGKFEAGASMVDYTFYTYGWNQDWIDDAVEDRTQENRRERWYSPRDSDQDWRQKMVFDGDRLDLPPLGWVLHWQGEYSNLVGTFVHFQLRRWGFGMWDASRLTTEAKEYIDFWYTELHCPEDYREEYYDPSVANPERGSQEWWDS